MNIDEDCKTADRAETDETTNPERTRPGVERRSYLSLAGSMIGSIGVSSGLSSAATDSKQTDTTTTTPAMETEFTSFSPTVDITDFGADPSDPSHDDSAAYNEAVQAVADSSGGSIALPSGTITFDSELDHYPLINGDGGNENSVTAFGVHGDGSEKTTVETTVSFEVNGTSRAEAFENFQLSGMTFDYTSATNESGIVNTVDGFEIVDVDVVGSPELRNVSGIWRNGVWRDSTLRDGDMDYAGLFDIQASNVLFQNVTCTGSSSAGFWHNGSENVVHLDCEAADCQGSGIGGENSPKNLTVIGGSYHHNGMRGLDVGGMSAFNTHLHDNSQEPGSNYDEMWGNVAIGNRIEGGAEIYVAAVNNTPPIDVHGSG